MTTTASLLQTLHRINRQKSDLQGQLRRGPWAVSRAQAKHMAALDRVEAIREKLKKDRMAVDSKQLQLREREAKLFKWEGMLNAAKDNREYQALKEQIAADRKANDVLSDEILEILESIDHTQVELTEAEARAKELELEWSKIRQQVESRRSILEQELQRIEQELTTAEQNLEGDLRRDYQRLVAAMGEDALSSLDGKCCSGCSQVLTPVLLDRLIMGQVVVCPACGRLVYKPADE